MTQRDYAAFYERLTHPFVTHPVWIIILKFVNRLIEVIMYGCYLLLLGILVYLGSRVSWQTALRQTLPYLLVPGLSFALLSLVRGWLNRPRPYEQWAIDPLIVRKKTGDSLPSRHVFSATVIAMCALRISWWWGLTLLFLAALLALVRVIGGIHYPRDVVVGGLCGLLAGSILFL